MTYTITRKHEIHTKLIEAKKTFDEVTSELANDEWKQKCIDKLFSNGEILFQITKSLEFLPHVIKDIQKGKGFSPPPKFIMTIMRFFFMGFVGRDLTPDEIRSRYALAHTAVLILLNKIHANEWQKKAKFFGEYVTIEQVFLSYLKSFHEDIERIKQTSTMR